MSTSHLASDPRRRPSSAQPQTELRMATCPRWRTMEAACGNARNDDDDDDDGKSRSPIAGDANDNESYEADRRR